MNRVFRPSYLLAGAALLLPFAGASLALAQSGTPDARDITPAVMLLLDTSGSMERMGSCACTTDGCAECLPTCQANAGVVAPNRWATVLQALTGTYDGFGCTQGTRLATDPDADYYLPHYDVTSTGQQANGILDTYGTRVRFGLMTFDNVPTLRNQPALVDSPTYNGLSGITSIAGDFSYGTTHNFLLPGCTTPYSLNNGSRNETATGYGRLYSPGPDSSTPESRALLVEAELPQIRPYGATPIAGMLSDYEYFLDNDPDVREVSSGVATGDRFHDCRKRYIILISDGNPNADMRGAPYFCETNGTCPYDEPDVIARRLCDPDADGCNGDVDGIYVVGFALNGDAAATARLDAIAVQGGTGAALLADDIETLKAQLATILNQTAPGTTSRAAPAMSSTAASSSSPVQSQFNAGFVVGLNGGPWSGVLERKRTQCDGTTASTQTVDSTDRFHEILNARQPDDRTIWTVIPAAAANSGGYLLGPSTGVTPMGSALTSSGGNKGHNGQGGSSCSTGNGNSGGGNSGGGNSGGGNSGGGNSGGGNSGGGNSGGGNSGGGNSGGGNSGGNSTSIYTALETNLALAPFRTDTTALTAAHFGLSTATAREALIEWVRGDRGGLPVMGDVYHSSPVVVGKPVFNLADESYNEYRRRPEVANRPTVLYVGTNDGILHAFAAEPTTITAGPHAGTTIAAGQELWGFVPPAVFSQLPNTMTGHAYTVDGTPYVREVFYRRLPGAAPDGSIYHTVLILPLGRGGGAYIALDVTDPLDPEFLWQFANDQMGDTLGAPALAQVLVTVNNQLEERVVAILPAGQTAPIDPNTCGPAIDGDSWDSPLGCPSQGNGTPPLNQGTANAVNHHRCWSTDGRGVYFVDPATGQVVQHLSDTVFNAPMTGGVGVYSGEPGTITTRAFMSDADGYLWRFDMSASDPEDWTADPFADMFEGMRTAQLPAIGQPAYSPPVVTTDTLGRVVVIQGTGNPEYLDGTAPNRVVSYTEVLDYDTSGTVNLGIETNWTVDLPQGEQVTGPIQLFNKVAYFSTFAATTSTNACALGTGRIWGLDYIGEGGSPVGKLEDAPGTFVQNISLPNEMVLGISISQQLTCVTFAPAADEYDPYIGMQSRQSIEGVGAAPFQLVGLTSGGSTSGGASVGQVTRTLEAPPSFTRVNGYAGRAD